MYYIKVIEWDKNGKETKPKYIKYFDKLKNQIYYSESIFCSQSYFSFEEMQKELEELKQFYKINKILISKIIIEYEF